jgi:hypothetical protein
MSHGGSIQAFVTAFNNGQPAPEPAELTVMRTNSLRIVTRLQALLDPVRASYITPNDNAAIRVITDEHDSIMTQWLNPIPADLTNVQKIAAHSERMSKAFNDLLPLYNTWGQRPLSDIIRAAVTLDGRFVANGLAWEHVIGVPALLDQTQQTLTGFLTAQIAQWRRPKLSKWLQTAGMDAATGYLRVVQLAAFAGKPTHLSLYIANINLDGDLSIDDGADAVLATLLPDVDNNYRGTHVTLELFGKDDPGNPKYFKGDLFRPGNATDHNLGPLGTTLDLVEAHLESELTAKVAATRQLLVTFIQNRLAALV